MEPRTCLEKIRDARKLVWEAMGREYARCLQVKQKGRGYQSDSELDVALAAWKHAECEYWASEKNLAEYGPCVRGGS
jgi:hypothetical protein